MVNCPACQKEISTEAQSCPHCGHPQQKAKAKKPKGGGWLIILIVIVGWAIYKGSNNDTVGSPAFDPSKPETIAGIISESSARPTATFEDGKLSLSYSLDPWMLTASTGKTEFYFQAKNFFGEAFSSPIVQRACIEATATFHDIKGNESQGKAGELCMSRGNAAGVRWDNIDTDNIPQIADSSFLHPAFDK